jgi:hypothetical protein
MMQSAAAKPLVEPAEAAPWRGGTREQIDRTMQAVAAGAEMSLHGAVHGVGWRRQGLLQRLISWPRLRGTP